MQPRLIGLKALQSYVGLGEKNAAQLGTLVTGMIEAVIVETDKSEKE